VLAFSAGAVIAGLTVYFSSADQPACLVSGAPKWQAPRSGSHRYMVVFPARAACFFAIDDANKLAGAVRLDGARGVAVAAPLLDDIALRTQRGVYRFDPRSGRMRSGGLAPFPSDTVNVVDARRHLMYVTRRNFLGFRVIDRRTATSLYDVSFKGFTWNPKFGPNPPSHGLVLSRDDSELWVLDAPNSTVHVFDLSPLPAAPPRQVKTIRLSKTLSGDESPCSTACERIGSLVASADGRYVYVGDVGDVIDTKKREIVTNLDALNNTRAAIEVVFSDGEPSYPLLPG
jgi:hypothetical protein